MIFALLLAASVLDLGRSHTLADIEASYAKVMSAWDADHDGKLSRRELRQMVDADWRRDKVPHRDRDEMKRIELRYFTAQDVNHDGYLTLDELLRVPRAEFACTDRDHDGIASSDEIFAAMSRGDCEFGAMEKAKR